MGALEPLWCEFQYRSAAVDLKDKFFALNYDERRWQAAENPEQSLLPFKPSDKLKSVTLEDMFRKQKLKQSAPVVVKEEQAEEDIVVGLQDLAEAMGE